ncbi:unnamed protein product [Ambrosiozyma monospora]|uniref:Unnamed protein product n=1 Tax=Ambrosiozyma monospora TaxID=43982 RepID=A0A9W6Z379_AMBMO|nr:unnamed protein product [Ambrosiozyma monospora]
MKLLSLCVCFLFTTSTSAIVVPDINEDELIDRYSTSVKSDQEIIDSTLKTLYSIGNNKNLTECEKCKDRLFLGKSLSLTNQELIPTIWTQWCSTATKHTFDYCQQYYARNTVVNGNSGTNFANLLSLMDPASLDSDYWCSLKENGACPMPETPEIDISFMWPEKPEKAYVAPEPSNETFNVLHVSDFHIETQYKIGSEANCSSYMCCTSHSTNKLPLPEGESPVSVCRLQ